MEVCVDSVQSAVNAQAGGATRVELCSSLSEGGLTPSSGMLQVVKQNVDIPIFVMIRPRAGDFLYSDHETEIMRIDIKDLKKAGADGFVFGALRQDGSVDRDKCQEFIDIARPKPITFHRAIDMSSDVLQALEAVIALGFERVLTSGGENTALEGSPVIRRMIEQADCRIKVMPGGGITERNLARIMEETGAREFHASARKTVSSDMCYHNTSVHMGGVYCAAEYNSKVTDPEMVRRYISISKMAN